MRWLGDMLEIFNCLLTAVFMMRCGCMLLIQFVVYEARAKKVGVK